MEKMGTKLWEKKEDLEFAWKFKQAYNLDYKHVCTC